MLFGRESEVARLVEAVQDARAASGSAIVVRGEPGIGKTVLLSGLAGQASDMLILTALGVEAESALAYAGLTELLGPALRLLPRIPERRRAALEAALGLSDQSAVDPFAAYAATLSLLAEAADERSVLVLVDDAHLLDAESANALRFSARRLVHDRVCIVLAMRAGEGVDFESSGFEALTLGGLDCGATMAMLRAAGTDEIAPAVRDRLHRATGGNPLALGELARRLSPAQLAGREELPDPLPVGPDVARAFGARIAGLPDGTQDALVLAAAADGGDIAVLERALRVRELDLEVLDAAERAELITLDAGQFAFVHPLIRTASYRRASPHARRDAHAALAAAMQGDAAKRARRAWHLAAATVGADESVAQELEAVAAEAGERGAPAVAASALEAAARVSSVGPERVRRLLDAAAAQHRAGAPDRALGLLDVAMAENADPLVRADAQRLRASVQSLRGAPGTIRTMLIDEATRVEVHDPVRAAAMRLDAAMASVMMGEPRTTLALAEKAWPVAEAAGPSLRPYAALVLGCARILRGQTESGNALIREAASVIEHGRSSTLGVFITQVAMCETWCGHILEARALLEGALATIRAEGALPALPNAVFGLAWTQMMLGDWRGAEATANESIMIAGEVGQFLFQLQPQTLLALIAGAQGRLDEGRRLASRALAEGSRNGVESSRTMAGWVLGRLELGAGNHEAAVAVLVPAGRFSLDRGLEEPSAAPWAQDLAEAYIRLGRHDDAEATIDVLARQAESTDGQFAHFGELRCRGLLAAERDFEALFQEALDWHEGFPVPFEQARTQLCFGERLRRAGRRTEARVQLRAALSTFDDLGAEPWAHRAVTELRGTGERARRRSPDTADQLTSQERQVATLVAEGASNREAAAALFVSPKTIESHLSHVYRKLGLHSRGQLAVRLASKDQGFP